MSKRKICVFTGSRADYGLLYWLMKIIQADPVLELQILATAAHLCPEFGETVKQIEADGFEIAAKVHMLLRGDADLTIAKSTGLGVINYAETFDRIRPQVLILLGDRFETLAAAQAALLLKIPIAHIHGGEITEGAVDEAIRHSITKMAYLHFTATEAYRLRVIQLGEAPERVFNTGAPGIDAIFRSKLITRTQLESSLGGFKLDAPTLIVTYHPETLSNQSSADEIEQLLRALEYFDDLHYVITYPNSDADHETIINAIIDFQQRYPERVYVTSALGQVRYLSLMQFASAVVGNSSSGITEPSYFKTPTVNIGNRQKGRIRPISVIDCEMNVQQIVNAIEYVLSPSFRSQLENLQPIFGDGSASKKIVDIIKNFPFDNLSKPFHDVVAIMDQQ